MRLLLFPALAALCWMSVCTLVPNRAGTARPGPSAATQRTGQNAHSSVHPPRHTAGE